MSGDGFATAGVVTTFSGTVAHYYDSCLGEAYLDELARETARRLPPQLSGDVLEIACGTGLLTRHAREMRGDDVRIVATDLSRDMLDYARLKVGERPGLEWREADAMALPYDAGSFNAVLCGLGYMFVPDKLAAFRETRRVLRPGGLLLFSVWGSLEDNPHATAAEMVVQEFCPDDPSMQLAKFAFGMCDTAALRELLTETRFENIRTEEHAVAFQTDARRLALGLIRGTPRALMMQQRGAPLNDVVEKLTAELAKFGGNPYVGTARALIVTCHAA